MQSSTTGCALEVEKQETLTKFLGGYVDAEVEGKEQEENKQDDDKVEEEEEAGVEKRRGERGELIEREEGDMILIRRIRI